MAWVRVMPILAAASHWPRSIEEIAARRISQMYAAMFSDRPISEAGIGSSSMPICGMPK
ncbi:hypothetical protein D3C75_1215000 [compost metagenome]